MDSPFASEAVRLLELQRYGLLDTPPDPDLDGLVELSAHVLRTPIALLSLVDHDRQFFKARVGLAETSSPRAGSFCAQAILGEGVFSVPDARSDPRFASHPFVAGGKRLRFYAGVPLVNRRRAALGTLCVLDTERRELSALETGTLEKLGRQMMSMLEQRRGAGLHGWLVGALDRELGAAVDAVRTSAGGILARGALAGGEAKRMVDVLAGVERLDGLLDTVTELARLGLGEHLELVRTRVDLRELCIDTIDELSAGLGVEFVLDARGDCTGIWDRERLGQAALLLLEEARERSGRKAIVRVTARPAAESVLLEVRIPASSDASNARILLARELIQAQGGRIEFRPSGDESVFVACLPRDPPA
ncbi:MAG: hypothetical protein NVSMB23_13070 [Myxococcales bacterium]